MVDCIVCRQPLDDILRHMNVEFHPGNCAKEVIKLGWHMINKEHKDNADPTQPTHPSVAHQQG